MRKVYWLGEDKQWKVVVWWDSDCYDTEDIGEDLIAAGAIGTMLREMMRSLWERKLNQGLTYVNNERKMAVLAIGKATERKEYANTIAHELCHLAVMLADAIGMDKDGEPFAYLLGELTRMTWDDSHKLTCPHCH